MVTYTYHFHAIVEGRLSAFVLCHRDSTLLNKCLDNIQTVSKDCHMKRGVTILVFKVDITTARSKARIG